MNNSATAPKPVIPSGDAIFGDDGLARCTWAAAPPANRVYHDREWGMPVHDEAALLERLTLEAFQAGLSWLTILNKRIAFRAAFHAFEADAVAAMTDADIERLMNNVGIVRNRKKIEAARINARATVGLRDSVGLASLIWSFRPASTPAPRTTADLTSESPESKALSKELRRRGFAFVGPTTMYALMSAIGMVDNHLLGCHRRGTSGLWTTSNEPSSRPLSRHR